MHCEPPLLSYLKMHSQLSTSDVNSTCLYPHVRIRAKWENCFRMLRGKYFDAILKCSTRPKKKIHNWNFGVQTDKMDQTLPQNFMVIVDTKVESARFDRILERLFRFLFYLCSAFNAALNMISSLHHEKAKPHKRMRFQNTYHYNWFF